MSENEPKRSGFQLLLVRYGSVIFILPSCLFAGYLLGHLADGWLQTGPWLSMLGLALGAVAGFIQLFRVLNRPL